MLKFKKIGFTFADSTTCLDTSSRFAKLGFTLAEVLITLGIIGIVAAITIPSLLANISERARNEQVRTFKYKFASATSEMNVAGDMHSYASTTDFVNAFSKHFKIISTCDNSNLEKCWPSKTINLPNKNGTYTSNSVNTIKTGTNLKALTAGTKNAATVGIISGDGVPMILTFSPNCIMSEGAGSSWAMLDGKPDTNSSTACISAIFDINGGAGPNKLGIDVRTINSLYGFVDLGSSYSNLTKANCAIYKKKLGIKDCRTDDQNDYWGGAMKACHDLHLHLPSPITLGTLVGSIYGTTDFGAYDRINNPDRAGGQNVGTNYTLTKSSDVAVTLGNGNYWTSAGIDDTLSWMRGIDTNKTFMYRSYRYNRNIALCVAD